MFRKKLPLRRDQNAKTFLSNIEGKV